MGDEGGVIDTFWQVAFRAGEQEYMIEVEITRFQYAHDLYAPGRFTVERYSC